MYRSQKTARELIGAAIGSSPDKMKLSIIIPHYNRVEALLACLNSIAANDYPQEFYEVIVVDDCSTQDIAAVIEYREIKNYRFERLPKNSGAASAPRNRGIDMAVGERLLFIDSDDEISNGYLKKGMELAEKGDCDIVTVKRINRFEEYYDDYKEDSSNIDLESLLRDNHIHSKFYRAKIIEEYGIKFDTNMKRYEDYHFSLRIWPLFQTAGVCVSESYFFAASDAIGLSRSKFGKELVVYLIENVVRDIFKIPDSVASLDKKSKVVNRILMYVVAAVIIDSPESLLRLKQEIGSYLSLVKDFQLNGRSRERLNAILNCGPDGRSKFADFEWQLGEPRGEGRAILFRSNSEENWQVAPGEATALADGWVLGADQRKGGHGIHRWNGSGWDRMPGAAMQIGGPYQRPWIIDDSGVRYIWHGGTWRKF
jgi:glycosyltransferase involved in cell wall biosynthesis